MVGRAHNDNRTSLGDALRQLADMVDAGEISGLVAVGVRPGYPPFKIFDARKVAHELLAGVEDLKLVLSNFNQKQKGH